MRYCLVLIALAAALSACGKEAGESISIQVFPAVLAADAGNAAAAWDSVAFSGTRRAPAGTYLVADQPLFTEWNIIAFKPASQADGTMAVTVRFNAYAARRMREFSADPANLKKPLAVRIDDRWADFMPLLGPADDRMTLYGFTRDEVDQLQHHIDSR